MLKFSGEAGELFEKEEDGWFEFAASHQSCSVLCHRTVEGVALSQSWPRDGSQARWKSHIDWAISTALSPNILCLLCLTTIPLQNLLPSQFCKIFPCFFFISQALLENLLNL